MASLGPCFLRTLWVNADLYAYLYLVSKEAPANMLNKTVSAAIPSFQMKNTEIASMLTKPETETDFFRKAYTLTAIAKSCAMISVESVFMNRNEAK